MAYKILLSPQAESDVDQIITLIAKDSIEIARKWNTSFWSKLESLTHQPLSGSLAPENERTSFEVRQIFLGIYRPIYVIDEEHQTVRLLTVRHGARRLMSKFELEGNEG